MAQSQLKNEHHPLHGFATILEKPRFHRKALISSNVCQKPVHTVVSPLDPTPLSRPFQKQTIHAV